MKSHHPQKRLRTSTRDALVLALALAWLPCIALAQPSNAAPPPPPFEPVPDAPTGAAPDPDLEPQVTITQQGDETHEEVRMGGELKFVRVTPRHGRTYYLIPDASGHNFIRRDSLDSGVKVPMWVLFSW
ncbi:MAG TPA: DUF2782 domain-containing protein [Casimicrobiaceae bacterium]